MNKAGCFISLEMSPDKFPTHLHDPSFWESLGRAVGTFSFLEEILARAIFAFTGTRPYDETEIQQASREWLPKLEHALSDQLKGLIDTFGKTIRDHPNVTVENLDQLLADLRRAADLRNILCHGSWQPPDSSGASLPLFMNRQKMLLETRMDRQYLDRVQKGTAELACAVINTVTLNGWQFPGTNGPGRPIWKS